MRPMCGTARSCTSACGNAASCRLSGCYPSLHALTVIRQHSRTTFSLHLCTPKPGTSFSTARATQAEVSTSNSGALPNAVGALPEQHHHSSCPRDTNRTPARPGPTRPDPPGHPAAQRGPRKRKLRAVLSAEAAGSGGGVGLNRWPLGRAGSTRAFPRRGGAGAAGPARPARGPLRARPEPRPARYGRRGGGRAARGVGAAGGSEWEIPPSSAARRGGSAVRER